MKGKIYEVVKTLKVQHTDGTESNYLGCIGEVFHELPNSVAVQVFGGIPILISKQDFLKASKEIPNYEKPMRYYESKDVSLYLHSIFVTKFRTIFFENEDEEEKAKDTALRIFKLKFDVHYNNIKFQFIESTGEKQNLNTEAMTKKTENTEQQETGLAVFEQQSKQINLPAIPEKMMIGGLEFSEAEIKKEVDAVKKIKLSSPGDVKTYEKLKTKKNQLVKTRTQPEAFRKEVTQPINKWMKDLKAQTDMYGTLAKEGEDHCIEQMAIYENWEAEQKRLEEERLEKLVLERREKLQAVGGIMNVASFSWRFEHSGHVFENEDLETLEEEDFNNFLQELTESFEAEREKKESELAEANKAKEAFKTARKQMLVLMGYVESNGVYSKNGYNVSDEEISSLTDEQWMATMTSHNTPKEQVNPFAVPAATGVSEPTKTEQTQSIPNPFASVFGAPKEVVESQQETNPFVNPVSTIPETSPKDQISTYEALEALFGDTTFKEYKLQKTTVRIFPTGETSHLNGLEVAFNGDFGNGISFAIYKNA